MRNRLRQRCRDGETSYGLWVTVESPSITEIAVALGLDWVCVDMEHGHLGFREVMEHVRAVRGSDTNVLVRVPEIQGSAIRRALDIGAHGVILPFVQSREDLETAMSFGRYPPQGVRGVGGDRAFKWGLGFHDYVTCANEETLIIPLIETRAAVENLDAILRVPGLEVVFLGPADMSASYGHLGEWEGPGVAERLLEIRTRADARGIATGIMARGIEDGCRRRDQGFRLVGLGSDMTLLLREIRENLEALEHRPEPRLWL